MMSTRVEHAYLGIKHRIVQGIDAPGTPLLETVLAQHLQTSRTPVREALARLLEEGYVEHVPGRGYFVTPITVTLIQDLFEVRRLLEGAAAARAAELADAAAIARLHELAGFEYAAATPPACAGPPKRTAPSTSRWRRPAATPSSRTSSGTASTR